MVVVIGLWKVVHVVGVSVSKVCGLETALAVLRAVDAVVDAVVDVGCCQSGQWVVLDNVMCVVDVAAYSVLEVEKSWDVDKREGLNDVMELVAVLGMVAAELVVGKGTSVVVWAVVAAVGVVVVNTARDTSWLLGKSNEVDVCMLICRSKQSLNLNLKKLYDRIQYDAAKWRSVQLTLIESLKLTIEKLIREGFSGETEAVKLCSIFQWKSQ